MEQVFDGDALRVKLDLMHQQQQLAFGASCATRLLPNYAAFLNETGWGDIAPLREALGLVWDFLGGHATSAETVVRLTEKCEANTPHSDDFSSLYANVAQDACLSILNVLDFVLDGDTGKVVHAATYATDCIDLYVQVIEDMGPQTPDREHRILTHPFMQRELRKQREDLEMIAHAPVLDAGFLAHLRSSWSNDGRSNLDLPQVLAERLPPSNSGNIPVQLSSTGE